MSTRITKLDDVRAAALPPFPPAMATLAPGVSSAYGAQAAFGSPAFARRDAAELTPQSCGAPADPIAGWLVRGSLWPMQRYALRIPQQWNGRLVVAGTPGQRTEYACDALFGDPLLARGYAYVCGNKGNGDGVALLQADAGLEVEGDVMPRFPLPGGLGLAFWQHARGHTIERWRDETIELTNLARDTIAGLHGRPPERTYAVGLSNGGYQVRRAIETSDLFDGALVWNAVLWTVEHNVLRSLSDAIDAIESGRPDRIAAAGFPPDVRSISGDGSLYRKNLFAYWYVTLWLHATHVDPETSMAYGDVDDPALAQSWSMRLRSWRFDRDPVIAQRVQGFSNTGTIACKLIDLGSEFDHLIPPAVHHAPYAQLVAAAGKSESYRGRIIARAQHVDPWSEDPAYPSMRPGYPEVMKAWDELVAWVDDG